MGTTALHKGAQSGNPEVILMLIDRGIFIDQQSAVLGNTALMDAILYKHVEIARLLIELGARLSIRNYWNQDASDLAQKEGLQDIVDEIDSNYKKRSEEVATLQLIPAIKSGNISQVKKALESGASVEERFPIIGSIDDDYSALGIAVREGTEEVIRLLLEAGADPWKPTGLMRGTSMHEAAFAGRSQVINAILQISALRGILPDVDAQGPYNGLTALHDAVWHGHLGAVKALVDAGANLHLTTHSGMTPLLLARHYGYDDICKFLTGNVKTNS
ncbi:ankyrin repeat domain-containing protein [Pedobacter lithocola]|uniref:Ankyrin repeat domain-containing protein n=1 Tax=Pedobacter lithocola TaxID=1908239 RepID=A0ABV8P6C9_9SPHI